MQSILDNLLLVPKLPRLGPVVGWTRVDGRLVARLWIQVDDTEDEVPLVALTAVWDRRARAVRANTARTWKLTHSVPPGTEPEYALRMATADVEVPSGDADCVIRMISIHRGAGTPVPQPLYRASSPFSYQPSHVTGAWLYALLARVHTATTQTNAPGAPPPEPEEVKLKQILPALALDLDAQAGEWFGEIEDRLEKAAQDAAQPERSSRSRRDLRLRTMAECEVELAPSARTQLAGNQAMLTFAATCCRYPGTGWDSERHARTFDAIADASRRDDGPALALLVGDQIYADKMAGAFDVADRFEKFALRYHAAFEAPPFRRCAARLPLYMAADDHEIEDGWSLARLTEAQISNRDRDRRHRVLDWARLTFLAFQRLHGPRFGPSLAQYWYAFDAAAVPFFVMDTRFERFASSGTAAHQICQAEQLDALAHWLGGQVEEERNGNKPAGVPKFIVSGSVFAPGLAEYTRDPPSARRADTWQAFPADRARLARIVRQSGAQNVVFLSGDYHCGAVAALKWQGQTAYAIVAPPAYAPFPFANETAADIARAEVILEPANSAEVARYDAVQPCDGEGYASIRVLRANGDWAIDVRFVSPEGTPYFAWRLAGGTITKLPPP